MSNTHKLSDSAIGALLVGVTGNIGSGKSTVCRILEELGAARVDADQLAREVVQPGARALEEIQKRFGSSVLREDGSLNRARLGEVVFSDSNALAALEAILHPAIREAATVAIESAIEAGKEIVVYEAALLLEKGLEEQVDKVLVITAPMETKCKRVRLRDGLPEEAFRSRVSQQMNSAKQVEKADLVIANGESLDTLHSRCKEAYKILKVWHSEKCD